MLKHRGCLSLGADITERPQVAPETNGWVTRTLSALMSSNTNTAVSVIGQSILGVSIFNHVLG